MLDGCTPQVPNIYRSPCWIPPEKTKSLKAKKNAPAQKKILKKKKKDPAFLELVIEKHHPFFRQNSKRTHTPGLPPKIREVSWTLKFVIHKSQQANTSWWLNQPIWKILVNVDHFPNFRGENLKKMKPPPKILQRNPTICFKLKRIHLWEKFQTPPEILCYPGANLL